MIPLRYRENALGVVAVIIGMTLVLLVYGAIPFVTLPTLGQALWTTGFAQSIANQSLMALTANNIGIPAPAPIAFGLAGAYPEAVLIFAGVAPQDAYTLMCVFWLTCSYAGAYFMARKFSVSVPASALLATTWLCLPIVWLHAGYSMLSIGIALLPSYFLAFLALLHSEAGTLRNQVMPIALLIVAAVVSVFLDGYTFVMFGTGSMMFLLHAWIAVPQQRKWIVRVTVPGTVLAFGTAYIAYASYMRHEAFWIPPLSYFRAWGADLSFLLVPSKSTSWILDAMHLTIGRTTDRWYGDSPVWETTFLLPLMLLSLPAWLYLRRRCKLIHVVLAVALCGMYMSFGPSLKAWSEKPSTLTQTSEDSQPMDASSARFATGSGILSAHLPGLSSMRASYRWAALCAFGLWLMLMLLHAHTRETRWRRWVFAATVITLCISIPPPEHLRDAIAYRKMFLRLQRDFFEPLAAAIPSGEKVAVLPHGNDFLMSYAAAKAQLFTYNVGGDKNIALASRRWPTAMLEVPDQTMPSDIGERAYELLIQGYADAVLVPFYVEPQASHMWPCLAQASERFSTRVIQPFGSDWPCPDQLSSQYAAMLSSLDATHELQVSRHRYFALIQLTPALRNQRAREFQLGNLLNNTFRYPIDFDAPQPAIRWLLPTGWHAYDGTRIWSSDHAQIQLPVPKSCRAKACAVTLHFQVFGAAMRHPVLVSFDSPNEGSQPQQIEATNGHNLDMRVELPRNRSFHTLDIVVDGATSPLARSGAPDGRVLGITVTTIDLMPSS